MSEFVVPTPTSDTSELLPTLGPALVDWMQEHLVFGPGDLRGLPAKLNEDQVRFLYWLYQVYPKGHAQAGRRMFKRAAIMLMKGSAKTEFGAWIAAAELHPTAPVRCDGFDAKAAPVGVGVRDPYIPCVAYTAEQSDELAFAALRSVLAEGPLADEFEIGLERITRKDGSGRAVSLATAPDARDGARTTFQLFDETHRMTLPRQIEAHQTMMSNLPKRRAADPWSLELTTAFVPGEGSVAEASWRYAHEVTQGKAKDARFFFFHRFAGDDHDLETDEGIRAAVAEAAGEADWIDLEGVLERWYDPTTDRSFFRRVWLAQPHQSLGQAFDIERWRELERPGYTPEDRTLIVLGFDGSARTDDAALVAVEVATGFVWPFGVWDQSEQDWDAVRAEVTAVVVDVFDRFNVWTMFCNSDFWSDTVAAWAGRFRQGKRERVVVFDAYRSRSKFGHAIRTFTAAIETGDLSHDADPVLASHLGNARKAATKLAAEDGQPLYLIRKERSDSPNTIDAAVAAILAWEARAACTAAGVTGRSVYEDHGLLTV